MGLVLKRKTENSDPTQPNDKPNGAKTADKNKKKNAKSTKLKTSPSKNNDDIDTKNSPNRIDVYQADYQFSLFKVERPKKSCNRYGKQKVNAILDDTSTYNSLFEDDLVLIKWLMTEYQISFLVFNKQDFSLKIPWDDSVFVDSNGCGHRLIRSSIQGNDKEKPQPHSVIPQKGSISDKIFPSDYFIFSYDSVFPEGIWKKKPIFLSRDIHKWSHGELYESGAFSRLEDFDKEVKMNIGKKVNVLLPIQIQDVIHEYVFTFNVNSVTVSSKIFPNPWSFFER